jgi:hypothetical protein
MIDSIAEGDPDIRLVLDLVEADPLGSWQRLDVVDAAEATADDFKGLEILAHSRITDLRTAWSGGLRPDLGGQVHFRERVVLRVTDEARRKQGVVFRTVLPVQEVEYRQPKDATPIRVRRVRGRDAAGATHLHYEIHVDLSRASVGQPVPFELASIVRFAALPAGRMPLVMQFDADLLTVWMLFPDDHPYKRYQLVTYPRGDDAKAEPLTSRYTIDHPYGRLIGWSVITPREGTVYECRWTGD